MFGGVEIYVNGPCFSPTDTIICAFGTGDKTIEVTGAFTLTIIFISSNIYSKKKKGIHLKLLLCVDDSLLNLGTHNLQGMQFQTQMKRQT